MADLGRCEERTTVTLSGAGTDTLVVEGAAGSVIEVVNLDGATKIKFTIDDADPAGADAEPHVVPASVGSYTEAKAGGEPADDVTVRLNASVAVEVHVGVVPR